MSILTFFQSYWIYIETIDNSSKKKKKQNKTKAKRMVKTSKDWLCHCDYKSF